MSWRRSAAVTAAVVAVSALLARGGEAERQVAPGDAVLGKGLARAVEHADKYWENTTVDWEDEEEADGFFDIWDESSTLLDMSAPRGTSRSLKYLKNQQAQFAKSGWNGHKPRGRRCNPDVAADEDRVCERNNDNHSKKQAGCNCKTKCHVWGDPHAATFYSACSNLVMTEPNIKYLLWRKREDALNDEVKFEIETWKKGGKVVGRKAYYNGEEVFDARYCHKKRRKPDAWMKSFELYSDAQQLASASTRRKDITVNVEFRCRDRKKLKKKNIPQLEAIISVEDDQVDAPDGQLDSSVNSTMGIGLAPATTGYFSDDEGICTDAVLYNAPSGTLNLNFKASDYKLNCQRQSDEVETSGRQCSCSAECATWGDPYFHSFYDKGCRNHKKCGFEQGKFQELSQRSFAYVAQDKFAVEYIVNKCNMVSGVRVYFMKNEAKEQYNSCRPHKIESATSENMDWSDFDVYQVMADEVCSTRQDTNKNTRKYIEIPSPEGDDAYASKYYSEELGGFDLGEDILINDELVPIPKNKGYSTCLRKKNLDPEQATAVVQFGTAKVQLKCHRSRGGYKYFNACIQRDEVKAKPFIINGKELEDPLSQLGNTELEGAVIANLELSAKTSGWCSIGAPLAESNPKLSMSSAAFEFRGVGETNNFVLATDGDTP